MLQLQLIERLTITHGHLGGCPFSDMIVCVLFLTSTRQTPPGALDFTTEYSMPVFDFRLLCIVRPEKDLLLRNLCSPQVVHKPRVFSRLRLK